MGSLRKAFEREKESVSLSKNLLENCSNLVDLSIVEQVLYLPSQVMALKEKVNYSKFRVDCNHATQSATGSLCVASLFVLQGCMLHTMHSCVFGSCFDS